MLVLVSEIMKITDERETQKKKKKKKKTTRGGDRSYTLNYTFTVIEKSVSERATVNE